ncbi:MauE/DoxX family redox-associated membrane protein [Brevibacillus agri]|uniref:MauE/DoxX family redox-associated membrane protein n=1 Tax=Brevibacillus agri TaxID=51101 RepID=UPI0006846AD5|nr:MauE/DoxX family redox-associated membrane protein [Brevibacillus agri]MED4572683.1 MauE/DoxX family redox-associated membrane protein [Brevibacillus agri]WHX31552.1 MauE/DoxX family redox-associated membrane protein [Brevibacillus agri]
MEEITLYMRSIVGTILLTAGYMKIKNIHEHSQVIKEYRLIPNSIIPYVAFFLITIEIMCGIGLYLGVYKYFTLLTAFTLLVVYSVAITINLVRGRNEISCGCGGVLGTHNLSWKLVIRNIFLLLLIIWLWFKPFVFGNIENVLIRGNWLEISVIMIILISWLTLLVVTTSKLMSSINTQAQRLFE